MEYATANKIKFISLLSTAIFVFIFGIVFSLLAGKFLNTKIPENYIEVEATITRFDKEENPSYDPYEDPESSKYNYTTIVEYTDLNGNTYKDVEYNSYDSKMKVGDKVKVYYNPDNPEEYMCDTSDIKIFFIIGIVISVVALGAIVFIIYKRRG